MNIQEALALLDSMSANGAELRRLVLANRLMEMTGNMVQHGPLQGFHLGHHATWRIADNCAKLLGLYEQEVCALVAALGKNRSTLIDLGAADGFYGVGMVAANHYRISHCFECAPESLNNIRQIAAQSGVQDRVILHGAAGDDFVDTVRQHHVDLRDAVVLSDVESSEFDIFTDACLASLTQTHIIIEIHDFQVPPPLGRQKYERLLTSAQRYFNITEIKTGARDLSHIPLVANHWTDTDRWLLCSESRATLMSWLHLSPR